jgi:hypothetical protein
MMKNKTIFGTLQRDNTQATILVLDELKLIMQQIFVD